MFRLLFQLPPVSPRRYQSTAIQRSSDFYFLHDLALRELLLGSFSVVEEGEKRCCCLLFLGSLLLRDELGPSAVGVTLLMADVLTVLLSCSGVVVMSADFLDNLLVLAGEEGIAAGFPRAGNCSSESTRGID